jgi:outer membrane protein assembly factor BamD (BamD/ComL family)
MVSGSTPSAAPSQADASPSPEEYVRQAKQEFDAGRVEQALAILEPMRQRYPSGTDEAWWLLGQLYEANSPARDIRLSLEYYRRLVNEYPQSNRVDDARRRIAYLERYYFNIR